MVHLPSGSACVKVHVLSPNRVLDVPPSAFLSPDIPGTTYKDTPCLSFLIEHTDDHGRLTRLLFDLGIRKDWESLPPSTVAAIKHMDITISTEHDVADMLQAKGVEVKSIDSVFFSHWHFDHVGDATRFPGTTRIVVGPGFKSNFLPGYPSDRNSMICGDGLDDQRVQELGFSESSLSIASMPAIDWFGDGSFYLLSTPGHAVGHISALARTTSGTAPGSESSFVFLAGDVCHHTGELRPHPGHPLPETLPCFGDTKDKFKSTSEYLTIHPEHSADRPFYRPSCGGFNLDSEQMQETLEKVALLDADSRVFTMLAHDHWLLSVVDHFPETVNTWKETGWAERSRWRFLQDFE